MDKKGNIIKPVKKKTEKSAAVYSLWFGLDYGSILTAYALYKTIEENGIKPYLLQKKPELWSNHYAEKDNIAGKFIYSHCDVLEVFDKAEDRNKFDNINVHIVGSDIVWNENVVGKQSGYYFFCSDAPEKSTKIAVGSSFGDEFTAVGNKHNDYAIYLRKFSGISVKDYEDADILREKFYIDPELILDPVFLCSKDSFIKCSKNSAAEKSETEKRFIFTYIKNGNLRKRKFLLSGNNILLEKSLYPLRNFIDINRYPKSLKAIGLDAAFHILVEDWLYYLVNSEFVITDDYYGMCFALIFEKPFVVMVDENMSDMSRYTSLLSLLELEERMVFVTDDFRKKEYLFRKPINYKKVNKILDKFRLQSIEWLKGKLISNDQNQAK